MHIGRGTSWIFLPCGTRLCWRLPSMLNVEIAYTTNRLYCAKLHITFQGCITTSECSLRPACTHHKHARGKDSMQMLADVSSKHMGAIRAITYKAYPQPTNACRRLIFIDTTYLQSYTRTRQMVLVIADALPIYTHWIYIPTSAQRTDACL